MTHQCINPFCRPFRKALSAWLDFEFQSSFLSSGLCMNKHLYRPIVGSNTKALKSVKAQPTTTTHNKAIIAIYFTQN
jgi:hypothetical protein